MRTVYFVAASNRLYHLLLTIIIYATGVKIKEENILYGCVTLLTKTETLT